MSRRIATLWDKKDEKEEREPEHEREAFYAGGSEHSGQQILGSGPREGLVEDLFNQARQSAPAGSSQNSNLPITFYRNGFTVDGGELRNYNDHKEFLECLKRGETPPELARRGVVDVRLDKKMHIDYQPEKNFQAFTGKGYRLGAPAPETESKD